MKTSASLFTGGGLFDIGARQAGYDVIWGIENVDRIAAVARRNGLNVLTADVTGVDFHHFQRPDHLHASPPCPNFSIAKAGGVETELDISLARAVGNALIALVPDTFTLENVVGYRNSESFRIITQTLTDLGYFWDAENLNAADFGVPQTRNRLFVRASKGLLTQYPAPVKWVGWYKAIEDLIDTLPDSEFAPWQLARLPQEFVDSFITRPAKYGPEERGDGFCGSETPAPTVKKKNTYMKAFIIPGSGNTRIIDAEPGKGVRNEDEPAMTILSDGGGRTPKAFIVSGSNSNGRTFVPREGNEPHFTITANMDRAPSRAQVDGRVVKMTIQALGRFQTVPDSYIGLTPKINGNGVPCKMAEGVLKTFGW